MPLITLNFIALTENREQNRDQKLYSLTELSREVRTSDEYQIYKDLLKIRTGFTICRLNFFNLKREISHYYLNVPNLWDVRTIRRTRFQNRITTSIYNFVTSSRSFLEYNDPKTHFLETNISCFMKELRNYIAHSEPMNLTSHVKHIPYRSNERSESFDIQGFKDELKQKISGSKRKLSQKEKALKYIEANQIKNKVHLLNVIDEYFESIAEIYEECILNYISKNQDSFDSLLSKSKYILSSMEEIKYSSSIVPLDRLKIRYLKYLLYLANK